MSDRLPLRYQIDHLFNPLFCLGIDRSSFIRRGPRCGWKFYIGFSVSLTQCCDMIIISEESGVGCVV